MQTAKRILKKAAADNKAPFEGLLNYRDTSFEDIGVSPVQLLMSRCTRTMIPTHRCLIAAASRSGSSGENSQTAPGCF